MITVVSCCWKRPEVFRCWIESWQSLSPKPHIVVAGSDLDECELIAIEYGIDYFKARNYPVGEKWNAAHKRAKDTADYYLTTGSDDVMDQKMWDYYVQFAGERLTLKDLYFWDVENHKALIWNGYTDSIKSGWAIGAHQLTRHDIMHRINFEPFNSKSMAHEHDTMKKLARIGIDDNAISMAETGGIGIDIKTKQSFSQFREWRNTQSFEPEKFGTLAPELYQTIKKYFPQS